MAIHSGILVLPGSSVGQESACSAGEEGYIPGSGSMLEKEMAAHSSTLSWRLPWTKEPPWDPKELDTTVSLTFPVLPG